MFVKCKFTSSKVVVSKDDYVTEYNETKNKFFSIKRTNFVDPANLISFSQVSNALHVLMGVRPAPINRVTFHKRSDYIDSLANNSWVRITNSYSYINKKGETHYYSEVTQGKKIAWNSNSSDSLITNVRGDNLPFKKGFVTWSIFKKKYYYHQKDLYNDAIATFEKLSGLSFEDIKSKYTFYEFITYLIADPKKEKELKKLGKRIKYKNITKLQTLSNAGSKDNLAILTINTYKAEKISLEGEIIYEINDENVIKHLLSCNKMALFLDGGMLKIIEVDDYINIDNEYVTKDELPNYNFKLITKN